MPDMIRVAYTTLAPFISGAERSLQAMLRHLPASGVAPLVIGPAQAAIRPWCVENRLPFFPCPLPLRDKWHPLRWWRSVRHMRRLLLETGVQVIHSNQMWSYPTAGAAGRDLGLPRVCHLRDDANPATLHWCCAAGLEAAVCISRHIKRQAEAAWPAGPTRPIIATLMSPVELTDRAAADVERLRRKAARAALGLPDDATVFGFVGQIREVKGLLGLLETLAALAARRPWRLLVAGRDPDPAGRYEALCRRRAAQDDLAGRVQFVGFLDDTEAFYRAIDCAVVPSLEEPLGRIPLEAGAMNRPAIAFDVGGLIDVIRHAETGWLVPPADWQALREALTQFLDHPTPEMGEAARSWVERVADPASHTQQLSALYARLMNRPPAADAGPIAQVLPCGRY